MRLDVFLKVSRLAIRRSTAQELCDAGLVKVNGQAAKSSKAVVVGNEIEIYRRNRKLVVKVVSLPRNKQASKSEAGSLYEVIEDRPVQDPLFSPGSA